MRKKYTNETGRLDLAIKVRRDMLFSERSKVHGTRMAAVGMLDEHDITEFCKKRRHVWSFYSHNSFAIGKSIRSSKKEILLSMLSTPRRAGAIISSARFTCEKGLQDKRFFSESEISDIAVSA